MNSAIPLAMVEAGLSLQLLGLATGLDDVRLAELIRGDQPTEYERRVLPALLGRNCFDDAAVTAGDVR